MILIGESDALIPRKTVGYTRLKGTLAKLHVSASLHKVEQITTDKFVDVNNPSDINGQLVERGEEAKVIWKEELGPLMPGRKVGIKTRTSYNRDDGKVENNVAECLVTMGQMGSLTIKAHPETMFGKTFGETITGKAIEHSQSCECTIWFGSTD